jgi:hypothetical protein
MRKDVAGAVAEVAVAPAGVAVHELEDEVRGVCVEGRPADGARAALDLLIQQDGIGVGLVVRREAGEHLEDEDAEGVPVDGFVIALLADDLVGALEGCAGERDKD